MSPAMAKTAESFVQGISDLPSLSTVTAELLRILEREDVSMRQILQLIARDPILSAKVVRLANSTFYGGLSNVSLDQSLMRIGFKEVRNVALTSAVIEAFPGMSSSFDLRAFWGHCIASGMSCYIVAQKAPALRGKDNAQMASGFYMCGLLHHLGILIHAMHAPEAWQQSFDLVQAEGIPLYEAEQRILGFDHAESGAALLQRWNFAPNVVSSVRDHHHPERAPEEHRSTVRILHVAATVCHSLQGEKASFEGHLQSFDEAAFFGLGFAIDDLAMLEAELSKAVKSAERLAEELF